MKYATSPSLSVGLFAFLDAFFGGRDRADMSLCASPPDAYSSRMMSLSAKLKSILVTTMALVLVLTSMATAMGQMRAAAVGEMVLCTGYGHRVVQIDAEGQPVEARTTCPDCLLTAAIPQAAATPDVRVITFSAADFQSFVASTPAQSAHGLANATRAPPTV